MEKIKNYFRRFPVLRNSYRKLWMAVQFAREGDSVGILANLGLLQKYAQVRRLKVPADLYTPEYFLGEDGCEGVNEFNESLGEKISRRLACVLSEIKQVEGGEFLDLGCGRGEILYQLEKKAKRVVGVDYSVAAVEISRKIVRKAEVIQADVVEFLPNYSASPFDGILMIDITEHLYDWELAIVFQQVDRLLRNAGCLYIDTPLLVNGYSQLHVNIKEKPEDYLQFLPNYSIEKTILTDSVGANHLIIFKKHQKG